MCPKCSSLYNPVDCITISSGISVSKTCTCVEFPNHSQKHHRGPCGALLIMKKKVWLNIQTCSPSCITPLKSILLRTGVLQQCNEWKNHVCNHGSLNHIMDGRVWKDFKFVNNRPFFDAPNNIGLVLNIDWLNPFEHTQDSIGAIYLTILNLRREQRYKIENTFLVGLMPGPTEPKRISPFLDPLIDEPLNLWDGVSIALLCFISDIPATRKIGGFPVFNARLGCSKCLK